MMATPKKKRGFRKIIVGGTRFNWRFSEVVDIRPESQKDNKLVVDVGWYDIWLYANDLENRPANELRTVTPDFVKQAIVFALMNNWDIAMKTGQMKLKYMNDNFIVDLTS